MRCKKCSHENDNIKRCCECCGSILEGWMINNLTGEWGYRTDIGDFLSLEKAEERGFVLTKNKRIMEENKNLPASEARKISEQKQLTVTQAIEQISADAHSGRTMSIFPNMHQDTITYLLKYGYKISKHTDPIGLDVIRVEW